MDFSKKIVIGCGIVAVMSSIVTIIACFCKIDATELGVLSGLAWSAFSVGIGFYFWKAKNENRIKLTKSMVKEWADAYGIESVTALAEIVLKE